MSTRSSIAVQHADGTVSAIYCHFDGYISGVGRALAMHFASIEKAEELVALGDCSSVSDADSIDKVVSYARDKGEWFEDVKPHKYASLDEYFENVGSQIGDNGYRYIFKDGAWFVWRKRRETLIELRRPKSWTKTRAKETFAQVEEQLSAG